MPQAAESQNTVDFGEMMFYIYNRAWKREELKSLHPGEKDTCFHGGLILLRVSSRTSGARLFPFSVLLLYRFLRKNAARKQVPVV